MAQAAGALTGIGGLIGVFGNYQAGQQAAAQSKRAAQVGRIQADQVDASYRDELNSTISNIRAIRAGAGVGGFSPTGMAIEADQERISTRDRRIEVGNRRMQANQDEDDARFRKSAATWSLIGGTAKSLPSFFGA